MLRFGFLVLAVAAAYGVLSAFLPERLRRRRLLARPPISFDDVYSEYFRDLPLSKELLQSLWREAAAELKVEAELLRPTDRFAVELAAPGFPLVDLNEGLTDRLREKRRSRQQRLKLAELTTLRDYIEASARLETAIAPGQADCQLWLVRTNGVKESRRASGRHGVDKGSGLNIDIFSGFAQIPPACHESYDWNDWNMSGRCGVQCTIDVNAF